MRGDCPFCDPTTVAHAVSANEFVYVVPNLTKYDLWELHDVEEHLMIIPRRHVETLEELSKDERLAVMDEAALYEAKGYNVYARGSGFIKRSVKHQHTHLIKVSNKRPKMALMITKPYFFAKKMTFRRQTTGLYLF